MTRQSWDTLYRYICTYSNGGRMESGCESDMKFKFVDSFYCSSFKASLALLWIVPKIIVRIRSDERMHLLHAQINELLLSDSLWDPHSLFIPPFRIRKYVNKTESSDATRYHITSGAWMALRNKALLEHKVRSSCVGMADRKEWSVRVACEVS